MSDDTTTTTNDTTTTTTQPWTASLADADARGFVELKGWDTPDKAIASYRELEKHIGAPADRLIRLPEKQDDPAWGAIKEKLGFAAPAEASEYDLPVPDGFTDDYAAFARDTFKAIGLPKNMARALVEKNNEWVQAQIAEQEKAIERGVNEAQAALKAEWGGRFEQTMTIARRAEEAMKADLGVGEDEMLAMMNSAPRAYYKMLAVYGSSIQEAPHISGDGSGTSPLRQMSPEAAQARVNQLKSDPSFRQRYIDGDAEASREMTHLLTIIDAAKNGR